MLFNFFNNELHWYEIIYINVIFNFYLVIFCINNYLFIWKSRKSLILQILGKKEKFAWMEVFTKEIIACISCKSSNRQRKKNSIFNAKLEFYRANDKDELQKWKWTNETNYFWKWLKLTPNYTWINLRKYDNL